MQVTEGIYKAGVEETAHPLSLFGEETAGVGVSHRVVNINILMADIIIPTNDEVGALAAEISHIVREIIQPLHLKSLPYFPAGTGRVVDADYRYFAEIGT